MKTIQKGWLCLTPVRMQIAGRDLAKSPECLALLAVYPTKKAGRVVSGPKAKFLRVRIGVK